MLSLCPRNLLLAGLGLLCGALPAMAPAAEYTLRAVVDQTAVYDGNLAMFPDPASASQDLRDKSVSGYELTPQLFMRARSPNWDLSLNTKLRFSRMSDQLYDSDDQLIDLTFSHAGDLARLDLAASIDRESTRASVEELGFIIAATRTERYTFSPRWTRTLSERNAVALGGSWSKLDYSETRFSDYEYYSVDVTWLRQLTEKNQLQLSVYSSNFDSGEKNLNPFESNRESDTIGLTVALDRNVSEALSTNFSIGARQVDTTTRFVDCALVIQGICVGPQQLQLEADSDGMTAAAGIDYEAQSWNVSASLSRSLVPNGAAGELLETDSLRVNYTRRLAESLNFDLVAQLTSEEEIDTSSFTRDWLRVEPRLRWRFAERWSLVSSLRYRSRDQRVQTVNGAVDNDADGIAVFFRVRYEHPRAQWSR